MKKQSEEMNDQLNLVLKKLNKLLATNKLLLSSIKEINFLCKNCSNVDYENSVISEIDDIVKVVLQDVAHLNTKE